MIFLYFPDGISPPCWIFKSIKFYMLRRSGGLRHITMPNFLKTNPRIAEICNFSHFQDGCCRHPWFWNHEILLANGVQRIKTHQHAKFRQNRSIDCEDIKIFRFFKMAAVRHLGFVCGIFGPPTLSTWGSLSLCKMWLWSMQQFL